MSLGHGAIGELAIGASMPLPTITVDAGARLDVLGNVRSDAKARLEIVNAIHVADGAVAIEVLAGARSDAGAMADTLANLKNDAGARADVLTSVAVLDVASLIEILEGVRTEDRSEIESFAGVGIDTAAQVESISPFLSDSALRVIRLSVAPNVFRTIKNSHIRVRLVFNVTRNK